MKKLLLGITILTFVLIASSAMAQDAITAGSIHPQSISPVAIQGKMVSIYSGDPGTTTVTAYPGDISLATTLVPSKYKSKNQWLIVNVTLQEHCPNDPMGTLVFVDGIPMYPGSAGVYRWECNVNSPTFYETRTRTWVLPPETLGGPVITPGATVDIRATSSGGTALITERNIVVQAVK